MATADVKSKIILSDSDEAASLKTITGWVSRRGFFYGDNERMARYDGCTHRVCDGCGEVIDRSDYCRACRLTKDAENHAAAPRKPWDGEALLWDMDRDRYYNDLDEAADYGTDHDPENDQPVSSMRLYICEPQYADQYMLDSSFFEEVLPDDHEGKLPDELQTAVDAFNAAVKAYGKPLSWVPGKYVPTFTDEQLGETI